MAPYEALYGRKCRSPIHWDDMGEKKYLGPELVQQTEEAIQKIHGVISFCKQGKLSPRYIGPYDIVERIEKVAYRLALPLALARVHDVFHVSILRKYVPDPSHVLRQEDIELNKDLTYEEQPVKILDNRVKQLRNKETSLVKVLWRSQQAEDAT
ncbi:uncharacterized protein LOC112093250 [Morus notabilis]|uniref:uncharacterized protein LOC112093250 n=1 Tax=Morus notabilis TaxID=981085 RepID=UPI000CED0DAF|nr:uncharacterized protein LOC112093250 [Morus notabilis]